MSHHPIICISPRNLSIASYAVLNRIPQPRIPDIWMIEKMVELLNPNTMPPILHPITQLSGGISTLRQIICFLESILQSFVLLSFSIFSKVILFSVLEQNEKYLGVIYLKKTVKIYVTFF